MESLLKWVGIIAFSFILTSFLVALCINAPIIFENIFIDAVLKSIFVAIGPLPLIFKIIKSRKNQ